MSISQRDIVEVEFNLPQGNIFHPAIVLSKNEAIDQEESFVAVMMTTTDHDDEFSYTITSDMLTKPLAGNIKHSEVRLHLIGFFKIENVRMNSHYNTQIKIDEFKTLIKYITELAFGVKVI
ncbi:MAG: type II toxin-antitoxin system PemK/MazF family toxin [Bacteroidia bacterium]